MSSSTSNNKWITSRIILALSCLLLVTVYFFSARAFMYSSFSFYSDFHIFHLVSNMSISGVYNFAYAKSFLVPLEMIHGAGEQFLPWSYPPQFALLLNLLGLLPLGVGYIVFVTVTFCSFFVLLKKISGPYFPTIILIALPCLILNFISGQNGFLSGSLILCCCLLYRKHPYLAGIALGLLVIKPHLAIGLGLYFLITRNWRVVASTFATILITSALCTVIYGPDVWVYFLQGLSETKEHLKADVYPFQRMTSVYAAAVLLGLDLSLAIKLQMVSAAIALSLIIAVCLRKDISAPIKMGLSLMLTIFISPYVYDYDQTIFIIGLTLIIPALSQRPRMITLIVGCSLLYLLLSYINAYNVVVHVGGLDQLYLNRTAGEIALVSLATPLLCIIIFLIWRDVRYMHRKPQTPTPSPAKMLLAVE